VIKSRWIGWAGHVVPMGQMRNAYKILVSKHEETSPLVKPRHWCGKIISEWILGK